MDKCKITVQYTFVDDVRENIYHTAIQTFTTDDYRICGDVIKLLKESGLNPEYKHYIEKF